MAIATLVINLIYRIKKPTNKKCYKVLQKFVEVTRFESATS